MVWVDGPHTGFMVDCVHPPFPLLAHGGTGPDGCCSIGHGFTSSVHGGLIAYGCMDRGLGSWWSRSNSISLSLAHVKPVQGGAAFFLLLLCFPTEFPRRRRARAKAPGGGSAWQQGRSRWRQIRCPPDTVVQWAWLGRVCECACVCPGAEKLRGEAGVEGRDRVGAWLAVVVVDDVEDNAGARWCSWWRHARRRSCGSDVA